MSEEITKKRKKLNTNASVTPAMFVGTWKVLNIEILPLSQKVSLHITSISIKELFSSYTGLDLVTVAIKKRMNKICRHLNIFAFK
jgi:hypothetical protein